MSYYAKHPPYNPYRTNTSPNPEPQYGRTSIKDQFKLVDKLSNHNNQLIEQIKQLSKKNQELNQLIESKLSKQEKSPPRYSNYRSPPKHNMNNDVYKSYTQPRDPKRYKQQQFEEQNRNRSASGHLFIKENHLKQSSFDSQPYGRDSRNQKKKKLTLTKDQSPQFRTSNLKNTFGSDLSKCLQEGRQQQQIDLEAADIDLPVSNDHRNTRNFDKRQQRSAEGIHMIRNSSPHRHFKDKQRPTQTKSKYKQWQRQQTQTKNQRKSNHPYLAVLTKSIQNPLVYYPSKESQLSACKSKTPKKSHYVYSNPPRFLYQ